MRASQAAVALAGEQRAAGAAPIRDRAGALLGDLAHQRASSVVVTRHDLDAVRLVVGHLRAEVGLEVVEVSMGSLDQAVVLDVVDRRGAERLLELDGPALVLAQRALEAL